MRKIFFIRTGLAASRKEEKHSDVVLQYEAESKGPLAHSVCKEEINNIFKSYFSYIEILKV